MKVLSKDDLTVCIIQKKVEKKINDVKKELNKHVKDI
jgi:hypothetical protein